MKDDLKEYKQKLEKELSAYMELPVSERSAAAVRGMAECWEQVDKLGKCMCGSADFSKEDAHHKFYEYVRHLLETYYNFL